MPIKATRVRASGSPVYVIAGFLGSGKTTLLKRVLAHELERGVKPAVLMNEFGEVDVDGAVLHEHPRSNEIELESLLSGCICCDLSGAFTEKVGHLLKKNAGRSAVRRDDRLGGHGPGGGRRRAGLGRAFGYGQVGLGDRDGRRAEIPGSRRVLARSERSSETSRYGGPE